MTNSKCVHLFTHFHLQWCDKNGGHPILHANFAALSLQNRSYCQWNYCTAEIGIFSLSVSCDLDVDLMTYIYELDCIPSRHTGCSKMNFLHQGFRKLL